MPSHSPNLSGSRPQVGSHQGEAELEAVRCTSAPVPLRCCCAGSTSRSGRLDLEKQFVVLIGDPDVTERRASAETRAGELHLPYELAGFGVDAIKRDAGTEPDGTFSERKRRAHTEFIFHLRDAIRGRIKVGNAWATPAGNPDVVVVGDDLAAIEDDRDHGDDGVLDRIDANDGIDIDDAHPERARADGDPLGAGVGGRSEVDEVNDLHLRRVDLRHRAGRVALVVCDPNISIENCNSDWAAATGKLVNQMASAETASTEGGSSK